MVVGHILEFINAFKDNRRRLLHIYGPEGYGKTEVANFAATYAVKGRVHLHGALFVDCADKSNLSLVVA